jgi:hypothetical protein
MSRDTTVGTDVELAGVGRPSENASQIHRMM